MENRKYKDIIISIGTICLILVFGLMSVGLGLKGAEFLWNFYESDMESSEKILLNTSNESAVMNDISTVNKEIALTFDDGPHPVWTEKLLDGLKEKGIKATFFVIGKSAEQYPEIIKRMQEEGHQIGNHTYSHVQLTKCDFSTALEEITKTQQVIYEITGMYPEYIRPPFGSWNESLQQESNLHTVLWDVDPLDWKVMNSNTIIKSVMEQTEDGSVILFHDVYETSVDAALKLIDIYQKQGYRFCTVEEIMIE